MLPTLGLKCQEKKRYLPKYGKDRKDIEKDTQHEFSLSVERCSHHEEATVRVGGESRE